MYPLQYGHLLPPERVEIRVFHSLPQSLHFHHALRLAKTVTWVGSVGQFLSDHSAAISGRSVARSLKPANTLLWEQYGQPVLFIVLLLTTASHSWPFLHLHITFLWEPIETSVGFILFFFDHCFASNGSNVAKSLIPAITLAPEHIGHFSPLERALTLVCHSCPQVPFHHTFLFEPKVISSGVSGKFFSDCYEAFYLIP